MSTHDGTDKVRSVALPTCGVCDRTQKDTDLSAPLKGWTEGYGLPSVICRDCMRAWREGGETDPEKIKASTLAKAAARAKEAPRG